MEQPDRLYLDSWVESQVNQGPMGKNCQFKKKTESHKWETVWESTESVTPSNGHTYPFEG